jgi:hypothetical protein
MPTFYSINSGNFSSGLATVVGDISAAGTSGFLLTTTYSYPTTLANTTTNPIYGVAFQLSAVSGPPTGTIDLILSATDGNSTTVSYPISGLTQFTSNANTVPGYPVGWQLFAFNSPITFTAGRTMRVGVKTSVANKVSLMGATLVNLNRSYVTTVLGNPAAGSNDVIHIVGSLSSTGLVTNTVNYDVNGLTTGNFYVHNGGVLNFSPSANTALTIAGSNGLQITPNGTVNIGTSSTPILSSVKHDIFLSNSFINVNNGGTFNVYGAYKSPVAYLSANTPVNAQIFYINSPVTNWVVNTDNVIVGPNDTALSTFELPIAIYQITNNYVHLWSAATFPHISSNIVPGLYNITRNVSVSGNTAYVRFIEGSISNINNASFVGLRNNTYKGLQFGTNSTGTVFLSNCVFSSNSNASTPAFSSVPLGNPITNVSIKGCTFYNYGTTTDIISLSSVSATNFSFTDNFILSASQNGMLIDRLSSNYVDIKNNFLVGSRQHGLLVINPVVLSGSIGGIGAMNGVCGAVVSGANIRSKFDGLAGHYNPQQGVNISGTIPQLSSTVFSNMSASFNRTYGFLLSGNPINLTSPARLNINGLVANNNLSGGFAAYSVCGNLSSMSFSNNSGADIRASLGSGDTIFDGITAINNNITLIKNGTSLSSASPFGSGVDGSIRFNGTSDYIRIPHFNLLNLSATPFTIECWINASYTNYSKYYAIFNKRSTTNIPYQGYIQQSSGKLSFYNGTEYASDYVVPANTWVHTAWVYNGTTLFIYANGVRSLSANLTISDDSTIPFRIGTTNETGEYFPGCISNFRLVRGTALYTSNFTPPTAPLSIIQNTVLLYKAPYGMAYLYDGISYINNINSGIVLSGANYSSTTIKNSRLIKNAYYPILLDSAKFEQFSVDSTVLSSNLEDFEAHTSSNLLEGSYQFNNCTFGTGILSSTLDSYQDEVFLENGFVVMKENGVANKHYRMLRSGKVSLDTTLAYGANTVSEKLEPTSATIKLRCGSKMVPVNKDDTYTIGVYVIKSASYSGSSPRLMLKRNTALGYEDTVLATSVSSNGNWELLSGVVPAALDQGVFEVYVDCSGTAGSGSVNIDNWSLT